MLAALVTLRTRKSRSPSPKLGDRGQLSPSTAAGAKRSAEQQSPRAKVAQHLEDALKMLGLGLSKKRTALYLDEYDQISMISDIT